SDGSPHSTSSLTKETSEGTDRTEESEGKGIGIERRRSRSRRGRRRRSGKSSSSPTTATGDITDEGEHGIDHKHANMYILEDTQTTTTTYSRSHYDLQTDEIPEVSMDGKDEDPTFTFPRSPMDTGNFQALASKLGKKLTPSSTMVTGKIAGFMNYYYSDLHYPKYFVGLFSPKAFLTLVHSVYASSSSIDTDDFLRTLLFLVPPYLTSWIRNMRAKKDESDEIVSEEREEKEEKGRSIADSRGIGEEMTDVNGHHISYPSLFSVGNVDLSEEVEEKEQIGFFIQTNVHQTYSVYRHETKNTRPLIRVREIPWNEAHTCHTTKEDALENLRMAWVGYKRVIEETLGFTGLILTRPDWDRFGGGECSEVMDTIMPCGRVLQTVGAHYLGQKFAKACDIKYLDEKNEFQHVWMTCYGVSTRLLAATLAVHGDDTGFILPPAIARYQVVVVPIIMKKKDSEVVFARCEEIMKDLQEAGIRATLDRSDQKPGAKFFHWEMKGVPLRIEVGPRDVKNGCSMFAPRLGGRAAKHIVKNEDMIGEVKKELDLMLVKLRERGFKFHSDRVTFCETIEEVKEAIEKKGGFARVPFFSMGFDGQDADDEMRELTGGEVRGFLASEEHEEGVKCLITGKPAKYWGYVARAY
ncbi:prolyl-tRNA synthetase, putative, partial [Aduncisulcus paluster]